MEKRSSQVSRVRSRKAWRKARKALEKELVLLLLLLLLFLNGVEHPEAYKGSAAWGGVYTFKSRYPILAMLYSI